MQISVNDDQNILKTIFKQFIKYKWTNLIILVLSILVGILIYYFSTPIYQAYTTVEVQQKIPFQKNDIEYNAPANHVGIETQIDILRSNFLLEKSIENLSMHTAYFEERGFKTVELYRGLPFILKKVTINDKVLFNKKIEITDIDEKHFHLKIKEGSLAKIKSKILNKIGLLKQAKKLSIDATFVYGTPIHYKKSYFIIEKIKDFKGKNYYFTLLNPEKVLSKVRKNFTVKPASFKSHVLMITYQDSIAQRTKDFLDVYINRYMHYIKKDLLQEQSRTLDFINEQLALVSRKLKLSEISLQGFKKKNKIANIKAQTLETIKRLNQFKEEYKTAQMEYVIVYKLYNDIQQGNYSAISSLSKEYPILNNLVTQLQQLQTQKVELDEIYTANHPKVISVNQSIQNVKSNIQKVAQGIYDRVHKKVVVLKSVIDEYNGILSQLPQKDIELTRYKNLFSVNDKIYNFLLEKQSEISLRKASIVPDKKVLDYPKLPEEKLSPKLSIILATWIFLGFVFALLHTWLRSMMDTKIKTVQDIQNLTSVPVFGKIPYVSDKKYNRAYAIEDPHSRATEALRKIRNNLDYIVSENDSKVILVTSSVPNEGKTTFAANLATVLGMGEKKAIVLSLDMRMPELHRKFGLSNEVGMSDVLSGKKEFKKVIWQSEPYENFYIVTSGKIPPNPTELVSSKKMKGLLDELRKSYDYIVLDTPPVNYVSDALALMKYADVVLFVVKSEFSEKKYIKDIDHMVKQLNIKNAGMIINSLKEKYDDNIKFDYSYIHHQVEV